MELTYMKIRCQYTLYSIYFMGTMGSGEVWPTADGSEFEGSQIQVLNLAWNIGALRKRSPLPAHFPCRGYPSNRFARKEFTGIGASAPEEHSSAG